MVYLGVEDSLKKKGKGAVDMLGQVFGKSGGAWAVQVGRKENHPAMLRGCVLLPYYCSCFPLWYVCWHMLGGQVWLVFMGVGYARMLTCSATNAKSSSVHTNHRGGGSGFLVKLAAALPLGLQNYVLCARHVGYVGYVGRRAGIRRTWRRSCNAP